jgi:uncharacterized membrane protein HdeD (DUF308 family)
LILGLAGLVLVFAITPAGLAWYGALVAVVGAGQFPDLSPPRRAQSWIAAAVALLYVLLGLGLIVLPQAAAGLEHLIAALYALSGISRLLWAVGWPKPLIAWGVGAGLAAVLGGAALLLVWPASVLWFLGAAVALDLAVYGASSVALGLMLRG